MATSTPAASTRTRTTKRTRNPRGAGGRLREDILTAGAALLEESGNEEAVTLRAVARRVGIAAPSIYAHFPNRETILLTIVQDAFAALAAQLHAAVKASGVDPTARLKAVCSAYLEFAVAWPQRYRVMFGGVWNAAEAQARPGVELNPDDLAVLGTDALHVLVQALQDCIDAGSSSSTDAFTDATAVWVGLHGLAQLRSAATLFPWPPHILDVVIGRLAALTPTPR